MAESILKWVDEEACKDAIRAVRKEEVEWAVISYEGTTGPASQKLKLLETGNGGVDGLKAALKDEIVCYCLLRVTDQIDNSVTTKFVYIGWVGTKVGYMQKSRVSVHVGPIKQFIGQFHVDLNVNTQDEITQEIIMSKVMDFSGSGSRVLDAAGNKALDSQAKTSNNRASVNFGAKRTGPANDQLTFVNEDEAKAHLKEVRSAGETDWVLFTYEDPKTNNVVFLGKGSGGVAEMAQHLKDDVVCYGLVRKVDQIDMTSHSKFCFVNYVGDNINRMLRARLGTHQGAARAFFAPFHVDLSCSQQSEISDDIVLKLIKSTSGTESKVLSDDRTIHTQKIVATKKVGDGSAPAEHAPAADAAPAASSPAPVAAAPKRTVVNRAPAASTGAADNGLGLLFDNEETVRGGLKSVRDDSSDINWCIVSYDAPRSKTLTLAGSGSGGVSEFIDNLKDDQVCYGLVRLIETVDNSQTVKFCFVNWTGQNIHRMQRATLSTHKGFITNLFAPFHVDLECEKKDEVSESIIYAKIKKAAGTANFVLN